MERDVLRKAQAEQQKATAENQEQVFDLKTAGPLELQQMIGNRATTSLLRGSGGTAIQTKLTVTDSNDQYEKEADSVAEQIVSGNAQTDVQRAAPEDDDAAMAKRIQRAGLEDELPEKEDEAALKRIQREAAMEDEALEVEDPAEPAEQEADAVADEATKDMGSGSEQEAPEKDSEEVALKRIQRAAGDEFSDDDIAQTMRIQRQVDMSKSFDVGGDVEDQIRSTGGGQSLDTGIQAKMESGTGHDFSGVRVHTDSQADALSESLGARAFTTGSDIFFKQGEYNPGTSEGDKLIAHESTHVIQQGGTQMKRDED
jgi:hypothetical protein